MKVMLEITQVSHAVQRTVLCQPNICSLTEENRGKMEKLDGVGWPQSTSTAHRLLANIRR